MFLTSLAAFPADMPRASQARLMPARMMPMPVAISSPRMAQVRPRTAAAPALTLTAFTPITPVNHATALDAAAELICASFAEFAHIIMARAAPASPVPMAIMPLMAMPICPTVAIKPW